MRRSLFWSGVGLSLVYTVLMYWAVGDRVATLRAMELNAVGDFMAGVFSPLAFLWLVLGFVQQGIELRISSDALGLQARELKASVEQQTELVIATRQSLMYEALSLEPVFHLKFDVFSEDFYEGGRREVYSFTLSNVGATCEQVVIYLVNGNLMPAAVFNFAIFEGNSSSSLNVVDVFGEDEEWEFTMRYMKADGKYGTQYFEVIPRVSAEPGEWCVSIQKIIK